MPKKKKTEPKEEVICYHDPESDETVLCEAMSLTALRGIPVGRKIKPGLYIASNMLIFSLGISINRGPCIYGPDQKGVYLNVCPWCQSDLLANWQKPVMAYVERVKSAVNTEGKAAS